MGLSLRIADSIAEAADSRDVVPFDEVLHRQLFDRRASTSGECPLFVRMNDPSNDVVFAGPEVPLLAAELSSLLGTSNPMLAKQLRAFLALCEQATNLGSGVVAVAD